MAKGPALVLGENVTGTLGDDGMLNLTIDMNRSLRRSKVRVDAKGNEKGGANIIIATTGPIVHIPGSPNGARIGLNIFRPPLASEA